MEDLAALNLGIEREEEEIRVRRGREKRCFRRQTFKLLGDGLVIEPPNSIQRQINFNRILLSFSSQIQMSFCVPFRANNKGPSSWPERGRAVHI